MAMQMVRVTIRRGPPGKGMVYPARYNAQEIETYGIGPGRLGGHGAYSGHLADGGEVEWCYIALPDELANAYAADPDMEIVDVDEADAEMDEWNVRKGAPEYVITDPERVRFIMDKKKLGMPTTAEEEAAIDHNSEVRGVNKPRMKARTILERTEAAKAGTLGKGRKNGQG